MNTYRSPKFFPGVNQACCFCTAKLKYTQYLFPEVKTIYTGTFCDISACLLSHDPKWATLIDVYHYVYPIR